MTLLMKEEINKVPILAFDTETSGAYPLSADIVEFGAIKYFNGQEIARLDFLFKPQRPVPDEIIKIHGITNEMLAEAPPISKHIEEIHHFFSGALALAHHAPFDMGFLAIEFERAGLSLPTDYVLCTSLLSRKLISSVENHKLQTLVKHLSIDGGVAHRACDDARACLMVGLECFKKMKQGATIQEALKIQGKEILWKNYSLIRDERAMIQSLIKAIAEKKNVEFKYEGGSQKGQLRTVSPIGIVKNPDGDYLMAFCLRELKNKRYYLNRINEVAIIG